MRISQRSHIENFNFFFSGLHTSSTNGFCMNWKWLAFLLLKSQSIQCAYLIFTGNGLFHQDYFAPNMQTQSILQCTRRHMRQKASVYRHTAQLRNSRYSFISVTIKLDRRPPAYQQQECCFRILRTQNVTSHRRISTQFQRILLELI